MILHKQLLIDRLDVRPSFLHRLTLRQLEIFLEVCRRHSYSRAAEELALTQPAVSAQIRQLEALVGEPLFDYVGRKLLVTPAGQVLERSARDLQQRLVTAEMELAELKGEIRGTLALAAETSAQYFLPAIIASFCEQHPGIEVQINFDNRSGVLKRLTDNREELVIMGAPPEDRGIQFIPFRENRLIVVAWPDHPLSRHTALTLLELSRETFLLREPGSGTRLIFEEVAQQQAIKLSRTQQLGSLEAIKAAIKSRSGIAVLPMDCCNEDIRSSSLVELQVDTFPLRRSWCTLHYRNRHLTPVGQRFLQYIVSGGAS